MKKSLVRKLEHFLSDVSLTEAAYLPAWNRLVNRFENLCKIVRTHFDTFFSTAEIKHEASLLSLYDQFTAAVNNLKTSGELMENWSCILAYMMYIRLDDRTRRDFKDTIIDRTKFFSCKSLLKFVARRVANVEDTEPSILSFTRSSEKKPQNKSQSRVTFHVTTGCIAYNGNHLLTECLRFMSLSPQDRYSLIKKAERCFNCFGTVGTIRCYILNPIPVVIAKLHLHHL